MDVFKFGKGGEIERAAAVMPAVGAAGGNRRTIC